MTQLIRRRWLIALGTLTLMGCKEMVLELADIANFSIKTTAMGDKVQITFSGLAFHSALGIQNIKQEIEGTEVIVIASLALANGNLSGRLFYSMEVPDSVTTVKWGRRKALVWERPVSK